MPPVCSLCRHPEQEAIDAALIEGRDSLRNIAERFGTSAPTLLRHREHVSATVALAVRAEEVTRADDLLGILHECARDARRIRDKAEQEGDLRCAVMSVKTLSDTVEKLVSVAERLAKKESDLASSPEWIDLRTRLLDTLERFPDAFEAVYRTMGPAGGDAR